MWDTVFAIKRGTEIEVYSFWIPNRKAIAKGKKVSIGYLCQKRTFLVVQSSTQARVQVFHAQTCLETRNQLFNFWAFDCQTVGGKTKANQWRKVWIQSKEGSWFHQGEQFGRWFAIVDSSQTTNKVRWVQSIRRHSQIIETCLRRVSCDLSFQSNPSQSEVQRKHWSHSKVIQTADNSKGCIT